MGGDFQCPDIPISMGYGHRLRWRRIQTEMDLCRAWRDGKNTSIASLADGLHSQPSVKTAF